MLFLLVKIRGRLGRPRCLQAAAMGDDAMACILTEDGEAALSWFDCKNARGGARSLAGSCCWALSGAVRAPSDSQGPIRLYQGPVRLYQGPIRLYQGPSKPYQGPSRPCQGPIRHYQGPIRLYQGPIRHYQGPARALLWSLCL